MQKDQQIHPPGPFDGVHCMKQRILRRRDIRSQFGWPVNDFSPVLPRRCRDLHIVRGHIHAVHQLRAARRLDGPRDQRFAGHRENVLPRNTLGPASRRDNGHARAISDLFHQLPLRLSDLFLAKK